MKKNEIVTLTVTGITGEGNGVGRVDTMAVFVPQTAVGDRLSVQIVQVKKNYAYGIVKEILEPSSDRVAVDCPSFSRCGGCTLRHLSYESECRVKAETVEQTMRRIGGVTVAPEPLLAAEKTDRYRNKAQFPVAAGGEVGFYAARSHRIVPCKDCLLQPEEFARAASVLKRWMQTYGVSHYDEATQSGLVRHWFLRKATATGEWMAVLVVNGETVPAEKELVQALRDECGEPLVSIWLNTNRRNTNVILGDSGRLLYGKPTVTDVLCGCSVRLSPDSFYQVNRDMAERLYRQVAEYAKPDGKTVLDLYCGAGTIGLSMAGRAKTVVGVEIVPQAVEDARENARANGFVNTRFLCADAAVAAEQLRAEGLHPDVVIVDPPRKGCSRELLQTVAVGFSPETLVYVSCDVATLARDTAVLRELGYSLRTYRPIDLFPRTAHVETVVLMSRA